MARYFWVKLSNDKMIAVESPHTESEEIEAGGRIDDLKEQAQESFQKGMELVQDVSQDVVKSLNSIKSDAKPNEAEVEFGIKIDAEVGALVTKVGGSAHFVVKLKWKLQ